jgi:hypothetical protein
MPQRKKISKPEDKHRTEVKQQLKNQQELSSGTTSRCGDLAKLLLACC